MRAFRSERGVVSMPDEDITSNILRAAIYALDLKDPRSTGS
jgi:hypothetical protein